MKYYVIVEEMNGCKFDDCAFDDIDMAMMFMRNCEKQNPDIQYHVEVRENRPNMIDVWETKKDTEDFRYVSKVCKLINDVINPYAYVSDSSYRYGSIKLFFHIEGKSYEEDIIIHFNLKTKKITMNEKEFKQRVEIDNMTKKDKEVLYKTFKVFEEMTKKYLR